MSDDYVFQIDNTSLEVFNTCPRSAEYRLVEARVPHPSSALIFGAAIHAGLEVWYKSFEDQQRLGETLQRHALHAALITYENESKNVAPIYLEGEWRSADRACDTLSRYFKHYYLNDVDGIVLDKDGRPCVERAFSAPLAIIPFNKELPQECFYEQHKEKTAFVRNVHVYWTGRIDLVVKDQGNTWVMDHKTTSMLGPSFWDTFTISSQMLGYCWAAEKVLLDGPVRGLLLNAIVGRKLTKTGVGTEFHRKHYYYTQDQIEDWKTNTIALVSMFLGSLKAGFFPQSTAWCVGKYGKCRYHDVCSLPSNQRHSLLHSDQFTHNTWSPLNNNDE